MDTTLLLGMTKNGLTPELINDIDFLDAMLDYVNQDVDDAFEKNPVAPMYIKPAAASKNPYL